MGLDIIEAERGISVATLDEHGVWWNDDDEDYPVRIPYYNRTGTWYERRLVDPRRRGNLPRGMQKVLQPTGKPPHLYNPLRLGPNAELLFFCEGEYDTLSVLDCGFQAIGTQGVSTFNRTWARLFGGSVNILAFDGDQAGRKAASDIASIFKSVGNTVYTFDVGDDNDLNDLHMEGELHDALMEFLLDNELVAYTGDDDG